MYLSILGKTEAILPPTEQIATETYREGDRIKCYIVEVKKTTKGPQIMISPNTIQVY